MIDIESFCYFLTDEGGFEPPIPFIACRFSKPVPSTTQTLTLKTGTNQKAEFYFFGSIYKQT